MSKKTTIALHIETLERLRKYGEFKESWEDILNKILDKLEGVTNEKV